MKNKLDFFKFLSFLVMISFITYGLHAQDEPGTVPKENRKIEKQIRDLRSPDGLNQIYSSTGNYFLSVDAIGSASSSMVVDVEKPTDAATVEIAILMSTTNFNTTIADGCVTLEGNDINWDGEVENNAGSDPDFFYSYWADVTSIVASSINGETAGTYQLDITECNTSRIDGEVLLVVFNDATSTEKTIIVLWGGQDTNGDTFNITLAETIDPNEPGVQLDMGLGIGFGFQGSSQYSQVDVNGQRLTTSAGGQDDGGSFNGALITAGGLGDSNDNPPNPNALPAEPRSDDELYSLLPFIDDQTTAISVNTLNPSDDDNVFLAYFCLSGAAIIGEGILLSQTETSAFVGEMHTVKATVVDDNGDPVVNRNVDFEIISGPNAGNTFSGDTDANGMVSYTYPGTGGPGFDQIEACFLNSQGVEVCSNVLTFEWLTPTTDDMFLPCDRIIGNFNTTTVAMADLDGDGDLDLVEGNWEEPNKIWCNRGKCAYFLYPYDFGETTQTWDIALGDLDDDGDLDAFEANNGANKVYLNDYPFIMNTVQDIGGSDSRSVALGDLDDDGDLDAVVANYNGENKVYLNDGNGNFTDNGSLSMMAAKSQGVVLADLDKDGDLDAVIANDGANEVYRNQGNATFVKLQNLGSANSTSVSAADVDADGDIDIFFTNFNSANAAYVNNGNASFSNTGLNLGTYMSWDADLGDLDLDGDVDAFIATDGPNKLLLNDLLMTVANGPNLGANDSRAVVLGDVDGDGDLDAFVGNYNHSNVVWINQEINHKSSSFLSLPDASLSNTLMNYPNPFDYQTTVSFTVEQPGYTHVAIYNTLGQEVMQLFDGYADIGQVYEVTIDTRFLPEGLYISRLHSSGQNVTNKMLLGR